MKKNKHLTLMLTLLISFCVYGQNASVFNGCPSGTETPTHVNAALENDVLQLINSERAKVGEAPLSRNSDLDRAAQYHAQDMGEDFYFSHTTYDRVSSVLIKIDSCNQVVRIKKFYPDEGLYPDETLFGGIGTFGASAADVVTGPYGWINSTSGHKEIMLNSIFNEIGIGYYYNSVDTMNHFWAATYGYRASAGGTQITISQSDFPSEGTKYTVYQVPNQGLPNLNDSVSVGSAGSSGSYDFAKLSSFVITDSAVSEFINPASTPFASQHAGANLAKLSYEIDSIGDTMITFYDYYTTATDHFEFNGVTAIADTSFMGSGGPSGVYDTTHASYNPVDTIISTSYQMGHTESEQTTLSASFTKMNIDHEEYTYKNIEVDGWGSLTTPIGTYDVIRVKVIQIDTSQESMSGIPIQNQRDTSYYYAYWGNGIGHPVVKVYMDSTFSFVQMVAYVDAEPVSVAIQESSAVENQNHFLIIPNPAKDQITISGSGLNNYTIHIYNLLGQSIISKTINSGNNRVDISSLKPGLFIVGLKGRDGQFISSKKLMVE